MTRTDWAFSRGVAVVYGAAAVIWLGMTALGVLGDCRPHDIDGQCGMSTAFAGLIGVAAAFVIIAGGRFLVRIPQQFFSPDERRFWIACGTAFLAGIAALNVCVVVAFMIDRPQALHGAIANGLAIWPITVFLGAPCIFAIVYLAVAASDAQLRQVGRISAFVPIGVSVVAGLLVGVVLGLHWTYSTHGNAWMAGGGGSTGLVVGWVLSRQCRIRTS